jgi:hypothetical protein
VSVTIVITSCTSTLPSELDKRIGDNSRCLRKCRIARMSVEAM